MRKWLKEEDDFLRKEYIIKGRRYCAEKLGRSVASIQWRASKFKLYRHRWTEEEIEKLKSIYSFETKEEILKALPRRTWDAITTRAQMMKLHRSQRIGQVKAANIKKMDENTLNYIAGFIDGEGCFGLSYMGKGNIVPRISIANTNLEVLSWIKESVGFGAVAPRKGRTKPCYEYYVQGFKRIPIFIKAFLPYLRVKKRDAELLLRWCELRIQDLINAPSLQKIPYTQEEMNIYNMLRKRKGKR
jgi:hypothetical protein